MLGESRVPEVCMNENYGENFEYFLDPQETVTGTPCFSRPILLKVFVFLCCGVDSSSARLAVGFSFAIHKYCNIYSSFPSNIRLFFSYRCL